jgi:putative tryptophan/tyrosine transport system substrate-binding protein
MISEPMHRMPIPWYSGPTGQFMRLNFSVVLIVTLLALSEDITSPQQPTKVHRIGWIAFNGSRPPPDFMTGLRERGYIEGQSIAIEYRSAQGSEKRLSEITAELVRLKPEVIVANGNDATDAARKATTTIPIVFEHGDPVGNGVVASLAQPEKNLTGLSVVSFELAGKRLELLRDAFPKISRVAVLLDPNASVHRRQFADMEKVALAWGIQLQPLPLRDSRFDFGSFSQRVTSQRGNALLMLQSPTFFRHRRAILDFAAKNRLPAIYPNGALVIAGGLMSYGVDYGALYRREAYYVDRILKGAKPSDLPVEQPTKFELVINLATANTLGLTIPAKVLTWADRVIGDGGRMPETIVATPNSGDVQRSAKIPRIGILSLGSDNPAINAFRAGLHELGWIEGQNITVERRFADGNEDRLPDLAAELLRTNVDIVVVTNARATRAVRQLSDNIPIVNTFIGPGISNLDHPTRNVTGLHSMPAELGGKRLEILNKIIPKISRVAVLANVIEVDPTQEASVKEINVVARSLGVQLQILNVKKPHEIDNAFSAMATGKAGALTVLTQGMFVLNRTRIIGLAANSRLPAMYPDSRFTDSGGLVSYGPNNAELYRRAAYFVDRILKGAKPAELPVEQPTKFELVINLKTAKQLNLTIPPKVLMWADRVLE